MSDSKDPWASLADTLGAAPAPEKAPAPRPETPAPRPAAPSRAASQEPRPQIATDWSSLSSDLGLEPDAAPPASAPRAAPTARETTPPPPPRAESETRPGPVADQGGGGWGGDFLDRPVSGRAAAPQSEEPRPREAARGEGGPSIDDAQAPAPRQGESRSGDRRGGDARGSGRGDGRRDRGRRGGRHRDDRDSARDGGDRGPSQDRDQDRGPRRERPAAEGPRGAEAPRPGHGEQPVPSEPRDPWAWGDEPIETPRTPERSRPENRDLGPRDDFDFDRGAAGDAVGTGASGELPRSSDEGGERIGEDGEPRRGRRRRGRRGGRGRRGRDRDGVTPRDADASEADDPLRDEANPDEASRLADAPERAGGEGESRRESRSRDDRGPRERRGERRDRRGDGPRGEQPPRSGGEGPRPDERSRPAPESATAPSSGFDWDAPLEAAAAPRARRDDDAPAGTDGGAEADGAGGEGGEDQAGRKRRRRGRRGGRRRSGRDRAEAREGAPPREPRPAGDEADDEPLPAGYGRAPAAAKPAGEGGKEEGEGRGRRRGRGRGERKDDAGRGEKSSRRQGGRGRRGEPELRSTSSLARGRRDDFAPVAGSYDEDDEGLDFLVSVDETSRDASRREPRRAEDDDVLAESGLAGVTDVPSWVEAIGIVIAGNLEARNRPGRGDDDRGRRGGRS